MICIRLFQIKYQYFSDNVWFNWAIILKFTVINYNWNRSLKYIDHYNIIVALDKIGNHVFYYIYNRSLLAQKQLTKDLEIKP